MKKNLIKVAICYDFDGTLAPGNMQEYGFMNTLGTTPDEFWGKSDKLADETKADKNLCYMLTMLREAKAKKIPFRKAMPSYCHKKAAVLKDNCNRHPEMAVHRHRPDCRVQSRCIRLP